MSLSLSSADIVAMGREKLLDLRDFVVVSYYRLRAARGSGSAAIAGLALVATVGAGLFVARHHLFPHSAPQMAAAPVATPAAAPAQAAAVVAPAPKPSAVADAPAAPAKIDMRVTGAIAPVDDPLKKKKKKKAKEHKSAIEAKKSLDPAH